MILLDTHVLLEVTGNQEPTHFGPAAVSAVDEAWHRHEVAVSAISFWEIGLLAEKERIRLSNSVGNIRETLLEHGVQEIPMDGTIAMHAAALEDFHRDPADRIIVSTALLAGYRLLTRDRKSLDWSGPLASQNARQWISVGLLGDAYRSGIQPRNSQQREVL